MFRLTSNVLQTTNAVRNQSRRNDNFFSFGNGQKRWPAKTPLYAESNHLPVSKDEQPSVFAAKKSHEMQNAPAAHYYASVSHPAPSVSVPKQHANASLHSGSIGFIAAVLAVTGITSTVRGVRKQIMENSSHQ